MDESPRLSIKRYPTPVPKMNISERQRKALITVLESGVGPRRSKLEIASAQYPGSLSVLIRSEASRALRI